jgi:hypothetical protein
MGNCTLYFDFPSVFRKWNIFHKMFGQKIYENFSKFLRKWFCKNKKISTKIIDQNNGQLYFVLWFSISISKEKLIPQKKVP